MQYQSVLFDKLVNLKKNPQKISAKTNVIISLRQKNWILLKTKFDTASFSTMLT